MNDQATEAVESQDPEAALLDALDDNPPPGDEQAEEGAAPDESDKPEEEEEAPAVSQKFRVKVKTDEGADEERDLSLEELAAGYMQSADYTRKTQAAAAQEKERQTQFFQAVQTTAQQAQQELQALQQVVMATAAQELQNVNWRQLANEDPARFVQLQARQQELKDVLGSIQQRNQHFQQQQEIVSRQQREQAMRHSLEHLSRELPGVNLEKEAQKLRENGKKYHFSEEELSSITDGRFIHLLHDAMKWRELQTAKPAALKKVTEAPKVIRPSAPQPKKQNAAALDRLRKGGRAEDLMAFL